MRHVGLLVAFVAATYLTSLTQAELITIGITASVQYVFDQAGHLEGKISVDDLLTGYYIYDTSAIDSNPSVHGGSYQYNTSPFGMWVSANGLTFGTDPSNVHFSITIINDSVQPISDDSYIVSASWLMPLSNGTIVNSMTWQLRDSTATVLASDALPTMAPVLSDWNDINHLYITGGPRGTEFSISATVISAEVIPEPMTVVLFTVGLLSLRKSRR